MAKGNPFLGMARGSAGDFTYYRMGGEQVFRARNRHPANPQTSLQLLQRVVMLTVQRAYSILSPLCDHAFQGRPEGTPNQSRFTALNTARFRSRDDIIDLIESYASGKYDVAPTMANFSGKYSMLPEINDYIIAEGTLTPMAAKWSAGFSVLDTGVQFEDIDAITYGEVCDFFGLQRGDQLTFIQLFCDDSTASGTFTDIKFARVILEPSDGDMDGSIFDQYQDSQGVFFIRKETANKSNVGEINFRNSSQGADNRLSFTFGRSTAAEVNGVAQSPAACAVIASRRSGDVWQRSSEILALRPFTVGTGNLQNDHEVDLIGDAMDSFLTAKSSTLYLNQAEEP